MSHDSLGDRMKRYEDTTRVRLLPRTPVLVRLDGKAFHTLTRSFEKPYDRGFQTAMWNLAQYLCHEIQGCRLAYVQSDEISLLLVDYEELNTASWFDNDLRKIVSVSASMAGAYFGWILPTVSTYVTNGSSFPVFDSRAWNIPREDVTNYFVWRQQDAVRNSVQALAQSQFSHKELHGLSCKSLLWKLEKDKGIIWGNLPTVQKRGACVVRELVQPPSMFCPDAPPVNLRHEFRLDLDPPTFSEDRQYVDRFVYPVDADSSTGDAEAA